jgi:uncharacterized DUF497 family protein
MEFQWDEEKRLPNIAKRQVDFDLAALVFDDPNRVEREDDRFDYGEKRMVAIGRVFTGMLLAVVYTDRGDRRRIIGAWRLGRRGETRYQTVHDRGDPGAGREG